MRIVHISDSHRRHEEILLPPGDVVVHTGDFTFSGEGEGEFLEWFSKLDQFQHRVFIRGNHDLQGYPPPHPRILMAEDRLFALGGVVFLGRGAHDHWWEPNQSLEEIRLRFPELQERQVDVYLSHVPPEGILAGDRFGSPRVLEEVHVLRPRLHLYGHVHRDYGRVVFGKTIYQNGSLFDGDFDEVLPLRPPLVIDV